MSYHAPPGFWNGGTPVLCELRVDGQTHGLGQHTEVHQELPVEKSKPEEGGVSKTLSASRRRRGERHPMRQKACRADHA
jgi:hypothetical protein